MQANVWKRRKAKKKKVVPVFFFLFLRICSWHICAYCIVFHSIYPRKKKKMVAIMRANLGISFNFPDLNFVVFFFFGFFYSLVYLFILHPITYAYENVWCTDVIFLSSQEKCCRQHGRILFFRFSFFSLLLILIQHYFYFALLLCEISHFIIIFILHFTFQR